MQAELQQNILLVDDRPENLLALESVLDYPNVNTLKAESGDEALRALLKNDISLILLDVQMPGMDGYQTASYIRGNPLTRQIPIIFVSAINKEQKHVFKGYEAGAIDYIFKPFDPDIMRSKVTVLLELDKHKRLVQLQNEELHKAKKNTDDILLHVKEGLFLVDQKFKIVPPYSRILETILDRTDIADQPLLSVFRDRIEDEIMESCKNFYDICFDPEIDEKVIQNLNPLSSVKYKILSCDKQQPETRYLSFECSRIYYKERIDKLMFTVTDKTEEYRLKQKLEKSVYEKHNQMRWLMSILHVDPALLKDFVDSVEQEIKQILSVLNNKAAKGEQLKQIDDIYRKTHQIKGNAAILDLKFFMNEAHRIEESIKRIKSNKSSTEDEYQNINNHIRQIQSGIEEINSLISRLSHVYKYFRPKRQYENEILIKSINNLIDNLVSSTGKQVKLDSKKFNGTLIPFTLRTELKQILIQLTRNAVYHGIEPPDERKKLRKNPVGKITIETLKNNGNIALRFRDDGRGLQIEKLKEHALSLKKWKKNEIQKWDRNQLCNIIFESGLSTSTNENLIAGRGMGMDIIKEMTEKHGGKIETKFEQGKFTEFLICYPQDKV